MIPCSWMYSKTVISWTMSCVVVSIEKRWPHLALMPSSDGPSISMTRACQSPMGPKQKIWGMKRALPRARAHVEGAKGATDYHLLLNENFAIWKGCENVITSQVKVLLWLNYLRVGQYAVLYIFADEQNELLQIVFFDFIHFFRLPVDTQEKKKVKDRLHGSSLINCASTLLNSTAFAALTLIIFARLNQVNSLLEAVSARHFNFFLFYKFSLFHTRTLGHVFLADTVCGQIILLMVVLFTPMNAYMFMTLILGKIQIPVLYPFIGAVFIGQFTVLFLFHYATTWYGTKIHSHAKRLLHLSVNSCCGNGSKNDFRSKLHSLHAKVKVHNYVEKFLTRKRYGIAYGGPTRGVNTVSMNSFAKTGTIQYSNGTVVH
ncbi:hypothetical protein TYRP_007456 [Tyrophagus putrescentiae]|nr:hypothetical protein TYRP_007456 [Tyrophagus putrescentiae]